MHANFADWYYICTTGTETNQTAELLNSRWQAIEMLAEKPEILEIIRATLQRPTTGEDYLGTFRQAFKETDVTFRMTGNDLEVSVLAGSLLSEILIKQTVEADRASLGLLCAVGIGVSRPHWIAPFVDNAEAYLDRRLRGLRLQHESGMKVFNPKTFKSHIDTFVTRLSENQPTQTSEGAKALFELLSNTLGNITQAVAKELAELRRQSELRKEETDVLSWLTAAVSRDAGVTFADLRAPAACLMAGKELADLVRPPGILAARSLLQGIIPPPKGKVTEKIVTLVSAVNATDRAWRERVTRSSGVETVADLCPVLGALKASLTTDEEEGWVGAYRKSYGVEPNNPVQPIGLSFQIHRECLLAKIG